MVGPETGGETTNRNTLETPPPGEGLRTATLAADAEAMSVAEIEAVRRTLLMNVVGRSEPFQVTEEVAVNPEPVSVSVNALPPTVAELGLSPLKNGAGLLIRKARSLMAVPGVGRVLSLTLTVKLKSPPAEGVPLKTPVPGAKEIPAGGVPELIDHW